MNPTFEEVFPVLYKGWDINAARADYNAGGWRNKAGAEQFLGQTQTQDPGSSAEQLLNTTLDFYRKQDEEARRKFGEFQRNNPFVFDEVLAQSRTQATEQIDPYYNELKADYLLGVQRKRERGAQDTYELLTDLNRVTEAGQLKVDEAISRAREGFAEAGLFESGARLRAEGLGERARTDLLAEQGFRERGIRTGFERELEDIATGQRQDIREAERRRFTDIEQLTGQLTKEAGQRYATGVYAAIPELQNASNFDILKQIGIYS